MGSTPPPSCCSRRGTPPTAVTLPLNVTAPVSHPLLENETNMLQLARHICLCHSAAASATCNSPQCPLNSVQYTKRGDWKYRGKKDVAKGRTLPRFTLFRTKPYVNAIAVEVEKKVLEFFADRTFDREAGELRVNGSRTTCLRSSVIGVDAFRLFRSLHGPEHYPEADIFTLRLIYYFGFSLGYSLAHKFEVLSRLADRESLNIAGPIAFCCMGFGRTEILKASRSLGRHESQRVEVHFVHDDDCNYTAEGESPQHLSEKSQFPTCGYSAGFSSGWMSWMTKKTILTCEIKCRSLHENNSNCYFISADAEDLPEALWRYQSRHDPPLACQPVTPALMWYHDVIAQNNPPQNNNNNTVAGVKGPSPMSMNLSTSQRIEAELLCHALFYPLPSSAPLTSTLSQNSQLCYRPFQLVLALCLHVYRWEQSQREPLESSALLRSQQQRLEGELVQFLVERYALQQEMSPTQGLTLWTIPTLQPQCTSLFLEAFQHLLLRLQTFHHHACSFTLSAGLHAGSLCHWQSNLQSVSDSSLWGEGAMIATECAQYCNHGQMAVTGNVRDAVPDMVTWKDQGSLDMDVHGLQHIFVTDFLLGG
jgi:hypothetical protein